MKVSVALFVGILLLLFLAVPIASAQTQALEQLVEMFRKKQILSPAEAENIKRIMAEDEAGMRQRETAVQEKEQRLGEKERELTRRENLLEDKSRELKVQTEEKSGGAGETSARAGMPTPPEEAKQGLSISASYRDGIVFSTPDPSIFSLSMGGLLQTDYRYHSYDNVNPQKDKFDLRRVRLLVGGRAFRYFDYKFEYEFQGVDTRNLLDAYVDAHAFPYFTLRAGQFKEPFGLEQYTKDKNILFAERSMGYYLTPGRDVGVMAHGSVLGDRVWYGAGLFNGSGRDDSSSGDVDEPEFTGRLLLAPWRAGGSPSLKDLQFGGSFSYSRIDRTNVQVDVRTTALTSLFDVASGAKFKVIREADTRYRYGAEAAWAWGPLAIMAEYVSLQFNGIATSASTFDAKMDDTYVALMWMITGEPFSFANGVLQPVRPRKALRDGGWGGFALAFRFDRFEAEESVYETLVNEGDSVRRAEAYTVAFNWFMDEHARIILDFTRTEFDRPLLVGRDTLTGDPMYSDYENVFTARFQFDY